MHLVAAGTSASTAQRLVDRGAVQLVAGALLGVRLCGRAVRTASALADPGALARNASAGVAVAVAAGRAVGARGPGGRGRACGAHRERPATSLSSWSVR